MKKGFTFLELVFVIVIIGILAKFGTSLLMTTYTSYSLSITNNRLQTNTALTLKQISNRLRYRIKPSVIARAAVGGGIIPIQGVGGNERAFEWIGYDIDGWLGSGASWNGAWYQPTWSGFIDVNDPNAIASNQAPLGGIPFLASPGSNFGAANAVILALNSPTGGGTNIGQTAIFFTGANSNVFTDYGYAGAQNFQVLAAAHPVTPAGNQLFDSTILPIAAWPPEQQAGLVAGNQSTFSNTDVYENYKLAWTAYTISFEDFDGDGQGAGGFDDLVLYYDYQPWNGETAAANGTQVLLLSDVETFKFRSIGETINVHVCTTENNVLADAAGGYAVCEEIAIF